MRSVLVFLWNTNETEVMTYLDELRAGHHVSGHPFFDYNGWYDERETEA